jgi:hypothetical protein
VTQPFAHRSVRPKDEVDQWRGYPKTQFRCLVVMQEMVRSEIPEQPQPRSCVVHVEVKPFVEEVAGGKPREEIECYVPGAGYDPRR